MEIDKSGLQSVTKFSYLKEMLEQYHCAKSVQIRSYSWSPFSCIRIEYGDLLRKYGPEITPHLDTFHVVHVYSLVDRLSLRELDFQLNFEFSQKLLTHLQLLETMRKPNINE